MSSEVNESSYSDPSKDIRNAVTPVRPAYFPGQCIPARSHRNRPVFASSADRQEAAASFRSQVSQYGSVRPGYPREVIDLLARHVNRIESSCHSSHPRILDIGAGPGSLTVDLEAWLPGAIIAADPSPDMASSCAQRLPGVPIIQSRAESTGLKDASLIAATCAQTWHWVDTYDACRELDRILVDEGVWLLVWNTLDVKIPWVHRLARIMHSGDILRPGFVPEVVEPWIIFDSWRGTFTQDITPSNIIELAHTRSYWLQAKPAIRERVDHNLRWYLCEHLALPEDQTIKLPYRTDAFIMRRHSSH
ncbi:class I SAM-dependent methyltransferase [Corynebacterium kroppenstedtii]|uniref:class I SAM-dependent methyltransferase n=1 Tax=Corynebacterium sp. PCR 32 TaxID=3351342 RepID=UPI0030A84B23